MKHYADSFEHLTDELARIDLLLRRAISLARTAAADEPPRELRGVVITDGEVDALLESRTVLGERWRRARAAPESEPDVEAELTALRGAIDTRRALSRAVGVDLALSRLASRFELSPVEVDVLLVAVGPELDPQYETLYAYAHNDATRRRPSVELALNLVCRNEREKVSARRIFSGRAPLLHHRLLRLGEELQDRAPTLLRRTLVVDPAIVSFLLDEPVDEARRPIVPSESVSLLEIEAPTRRALANLVECLAGGEEPSGAVRLVGSADAPHREAAEAIAHALGRRVMFVARSELVREPENAALIVRDAILHDVVLAIEGDEASDAEGDARAADEVQLWKQIDGFGGPVLLLGPPSAFATGPPGRSGWRVELDAPSYALRRRMWERAIHGRAAPADVSRLADTFRFTGARIQETVDLAGRMAALRDPALAAPAVEDYLEAGRTLASPRLGRYATRILPRYGWDDIVLPPARVEQLRAISSRLRHRHRVHRDWGFGDKLSRGKGTTVLFQGPSGTGKSMAAEVLARELGLAIYQIDLSNVVSKYVGETEKHLSAIFREAELGQSMLFFDEADALFGKRTELRDAHDRYANVEIDYLLQRVEQFEGVVVLATNLQRNVDEAFLRRMQEVVDFPFPDAASRERIWRAHFPPAAPRSDDIDFAFLAKQFQIAGGNIKNVVLGAAFLAAEDDRPIAMVDLVLAIKTELTKLGKACVKSDFGRYYGLVT